jgi:hypothetical protein
MKYHIGTSDHSCDQNLEAFLFWHCPVEPVISGPPPDFSGDWDYIPPDPEDFAME